MATAQAGMFKVTQSKCSVACALHCVALKERSIRVILPSQQLGFVCRLVKLGVPLSAQAILSFSATLVSISFIGHIGKHELSAAILGTSLFNVTGLSILIGLCSAMETLSGQVWNSSKHKPLLLLLQNVLHMQFPSTATQLVNGVCSSWLEYAELWSKELQ